MRACLESAGVDTKSTKADVQGTHPAAFYIGKSVISSTGLVLIFKNAAAARHDFFSYFTAPVPDPQDAPAVLQAANVELLVATSTMPAKLAVLKRCVLGPHAHPMVSPAVPGQPVPTRQDADLSAAVRRQIASLHVFQRTQNQQDTAGDLGLVPGYVPSFTRLAAILPNHDRIYFAVYQGVGRHGLGSGIVQWWLPGETNAGFGGIPTLTSQSPFPGPSIGAGGVGGETILEAVVPNNVARVTWSWKRTSRRPALTLKIWTPDNFAIGLAPAGYSLFPSAATAYSASGNVVGKSSNGTG